LFLTGLIWMLAGMMVRADIDIKSDTISPLEMMEKYSGYEIRLEDRNAATCHGYHVLKFYAWTWRNESGCGWEYEPARSPAAAIIFYGRLDYRPFEMPMACIEYHDGCPIVRWQTQADPARIRQILQYEGICPI